jgi:hypothetical protein
VALPRLASVDKLASWLGATIERDDRRAQEVLDAASGLVRAAAGQAWVTSDGELITDVPAVAVTVTLTAAARAWMNPAGASDQRTGPFGASWPTGAAGVMLTPDEREMLSALKGGVSGLSSVRVVAPARASASRIIGWPPYLEEDDDE